ncbi:unnamed protein product [Cylindrotheca closterium]|uniref:Flavin-containing monooxygenase n=1 Tax=Cylindrotheca closterium TaxID=2856 RepID=A0AAD2CJZ8_9STRA|nr:unnamed protein product [Cylindrotheca closterium]
MERVVSLTLKQEKPKIAIIGAGAAGLCTARVLSRDLGVDPTVFEAKSHGGGVWKYEESSSEKHPMYRGLRTNLPKEVMAFREKPWTGVKNSFVTHKDVAQYLADYEKDFDLKKSIKYSSPVHQLTILDEKDAGSSSFSPETESWPKIRLDYGESGDDQSDVYDAVFVCNGHYAMPSSPAVPGLKEYFDGEVMHSVSYDDPSKFEGKTVLCVGGRASGSDLAREISFHANHVYLSDTTCTLNEDSTPQSQGEVTWVPKTMEVLEDGSVKFDMGCAVTPKVDVIIFCSGYDYKFPFINKESNLNFQCVPGERRVMPLYKQFWHAQFPNLCFVGIPHSVVPFPFFEIQAESAAAQFKSLSLPDPAARAEEAASDSTSGGAKGGRIQDAHFLGSAQWDYCRMMAKIGGIYNDEIEGYIATNKAIYDHNGKARKALFPGGPDSYREIKYNRQGNEWSILQEQVSTV